MGGWERRQDDGGGASYERCEHGVNGKGRLWCRSYMSYGVWRRMLMPRNTSVVEQQRGHQPTNPPQYPMLTISDITDFCMLTDTELYNSPNAIKTDLTTIASLPPSRSGGLNSIRRKKRQEKTDKLGRKDEEQMDLFPSFSHSHSPSVKPTSVRRLWGFLASSSRLR